MTTLTSSGTFLFSSSESWWTLCPASSLYGPPLPPRPAVSLPPVPPAQVFPPTWGAFFSSIYNINYACMMALICKDKRVYIKAGQFNVLGLKIAQGSHEYIQGDLIARSMTFELARVERSTSKFAQGKPQTHSAYSTFEPVRSIYYCLVCICVCVHI